MFSNIFLLIVFSIKLIVVYSETIEQLIPGNYNNFKNLTITPLQYIDGFFFDQFNCISEPGSRLDIAKLLMAVNFGLNMTCNGVVVENYRNLDYLLVLGNGDIDTLLVDHKNVISVTIDGDQYLREAGIVRSGLCAGTRIQGWSIFLPPSPGQCVDKPLTSLKPLFERWQLSGTCRAKCSGQSFFAFKDGLKP
ncbi:uncharacterized protein LOC128956106 [Oppia nitens]|uniref:uncharacterized protein LOC128956106 n=1 Tax=Oppia nitens TaxID=1686743 RepID=UPI0023D9D6FB|nr:uncharacterized protein LOC128956106 [Oppia nitens]